MGYFDSLDQYKLETVEPLEYKTNLFVSNEVRRALLIDQLKNVNAMNDDQIKNMIMKNYAIMLNYDHFLCDIINKEYCMDLFTNERFLICFLSVLNFLNLDNNQIICFNKIVLAIMKDNPNCKYLDLLKQIASQLDKNRILQLSAILGIEKSKELTIIGNSSFMFYRRAIKIHNYLMNLNIDLSVQNIVDIFLLFFKSSYSQIFTALMNLNLIDPNKYKMYDNITIALFEIINSMSIYDMYKVFYDYLYSQKLNTSSNSTTRKINVILSNYSNNSNYIFLIEAYNKAKNDIENNSL